MRRCILHIGVNKTGSTALQETLRAGAEGLRRNHRIGYFAAERSQISLFALFPGQSPWFERMMRTNVGQSTEVRAAYLSRVRAMWEAHLSRDGTNVEIISCEEFSNLRDIAAVTGLRDFLARFFDRIDVVAYLRPHLGWTQSATQQLVKGGTPLARVHASFTGAASPDDLLPAVRPDPVRSAIAPFQEVFGSGNVHLRDARRDHLIGGDISRDFLALTLDRTPEDLGLVPLSANESLDQGAALVLDVINRHVPFWAGSYPNIARSRNMRALMLDLPRREVFGLMGVDWAALRAIWRDDVAWLADVTDGRLSFQDEPAPPAGRDLLDPALEPVILSLHNALWSQEQDMARARLQLRRKLLVEARTEEEIATHAPVLRGQALASADMDLRQQAVQLLRRKGQDALADDILVQTVEFHSEPEARGRAAALRDASP